MNNSSKLLTNLYSLKRKGIKYGLLPMYRALEKIEFSIPTIKIVGTNGKGSTAAYLEAILRSHGLKTGLFTSPHLISYNERFRINGQPIDWDLLWDAINTVNKLNLDLTFFETSTIASLILFQQQKCDVVIMEAGLGGRLDSTRVIPSKLLGITSIDKDHAHLLTSYLPNITWEKAGAIPLQGTVIIGKISKDLKQIIQEISNIKNSNLLAFNEDFYATKKQDFILWEMQDQFLKIPSLLSGEHHISNIGVATTIAKTFLGKLKQENLNNLSLQWEGRFQRIKNLLLDGAHNPQAINALVNTIKQKNIQIYQIVIGFMEDKDVNPMIKTLMDLNAPFIPFNPDKNRGLKSDQLANIIQLLGGTIIHSTLEDIISSSQGTILITGSFYLVGKVLSLIKGSEFESLTDPSHLGTIKI